MREIAGQLIGQGKVTNSHRAWLGVEVAATTSGGLRPGQAVRVALADPGGAGRTAQVTLGQFPG